MKKKYINDKKIKNNKKNCEKISLNKINSKKEVLTSFFLDKNYVPMTTKQIKNFLEVPVEDYLLFDKVLEELENDAFLYLDDSKRYRVVNKLQSIRCTYEGKNEKFGFAVSENDNINKIRIESINNMGAMSGDIVLVSMTDLSKNEGKVTKIIKRNTKKVIGKLIKNRNFGFVEPIDTKIPDIYIPKKSTNNYKDQDIVEVELTKYATLKSKSEGKIIRKITDSLDELSYVKALYESYGLDNKLKFSKAVEEEIEKIPDEVLNEEKVGRVDRTSFNNIFTIDSEDAKDLDDAISVIKNKDGSYTLSVYIADVSHYVRPKTDLNKEAISRGTSIYIPGTVIPMLPKKLSNGICSLNENQERLALAVDMKINESGEVIDSDIFKAVIKVKKKMTYEKVYKVLSDNINDEEVENEYEAYKKDLKLFYELSQILEAKRKKDGTINFEIPETKVILNENGNVEDIHSYEITFANKIIEEFMLVTNMVVAERFNLLQIPFIYRIHELPDEEKLRELNELLNNYGKRIKNIKKIHSKAIASILEEFENTENYEIISHSVLRSLKLARYSNECVGHFGLSAKYYCHFTSPIRRYPDLFIHRVISECIENNYVLSDNLMSVFSKQSEKYSVSSSDTEKDATKIERDFVDLYKAIYMKKYVGEIYDAKVSSVTQFGMFVELPNTVEGLVPFDNMPRNDYYDYDDTRKILIGRNTGEIFRLGDKVRVKLTRVDIRSRQIDFKVI